MGEAASEGYVEDLFGKCLEGVIPTNDMIRLWLISLEKRVRRLEAARARSPHVTGSKPERPG